MDVLDELGGGFQTAVGRSGLKVVTGNAVNDCEKLCNDVRHLIVDVVVVHYGVKDVAGGHGSVGR